MSHVDPDNSQDDPRVLSYLAVRRWLGVLGLVLPISLYVYARGYDGGMRPSISEFYHSHMGDVLVGTLVAIGVFLITYKGYPRQPGERLSDQVVSTIAGLGAIGVALFPTAQPVDKLCPPGESFAGAGPSGADLTCPIQGFVRHWETAEYVHFISAVVFFVMLAIFCFFLFPRGDTKNGEIDWKAPKNRVYLTCGILIVVSIAMLLLHWMLPFKDALRSVNWVFWWETVAVLAFAISWLTKGRITQVVTRR